VPRCYPSASGAQHPAQPDDPLAGADFTDASDDADRVLAVCDDVIVSHEGDGDLAVFDREATSFAAAVGSALADLEGSLPAARVLRVEAVPVAGELSVAGSAEPQPVSRIRQSVGVLDTPRPWTAGS